jgi:hypothetical protein
VDGTFSYFAPSNANLWKLSKKWDYGWLDDK